MNILGVAVAGLSLRVGNETRGWTAGKVVVFDDSFEHEVWHRGTEDRYVLYMSIWKQEFGRIEPNAQPQFWLRNSEAERADDIDVMAGLL